MNEKLKKSREPKWPIDSVVNEGQFQQAGEYCTSVHGQHTGGRTVLTLTISFSKYFGAEDWSSLDTCSLADRGSEHRIRRRKRHRQKKRYKRPFTTLQEPRCI